MPATGKELYMDISDEAAGGSLFRIAGEGETFFLYEHSQYNSDKDEIKVFTTRYTDFDSFWKELTHSKPWYFLHPLFLHPEIRPFIQGLLRSADWSVSGNKKWQDSHRRQWTKVLSAPPTYYRGPLK